MGKIKFDRNIKREKFLSWKLKYLKILIFLENCVNIKKNFFNKINFIKNVMIFSCVNLIGEKLFFDWIY